METELGAAIHNALEFRSNTMESQASPESKSIGGFSLQRRCAVFLNHFPDQFRACSRRTLMLGRAAYKSIQPGIEATSLLWNDSVFSSSSLHIPAPRLNGSGWTFDGH